MLELSIWLLPENKRWLIRSCNHDRARRLLYDVPFWLLDGFAHDATHRRIECELFAAGASAVSEFCASCRPLARAARVATSAGPGKRSAKTVRRINPTHRAFETLAHSEF